MKWLLAIGFIPPDVDQGEKTADLGQSGLGQLRNITKQSDPVTQ
jgi:hypothetical protein